MSSDDALPNLEERFLPNNNWQENFFKNPETDHTIRYCNALIHAPIGTVICLPGLSEFCEKYIETSKFFNAKGYNFYVLDWAYQGLSSRSINNPHKRSSDGYKTDLSDLNYLISNIIKENAPLYMLGHSMGGHIGLRYLATQKHYIKAASFSAPMLGIKNLRHIPWLIKFFLFPLSSFYVPGGKNWHEKMRKNDGSDIFSSDPIRDHIHQAWSLVNPKLQIGNVTYQWVFESLKSISFLKKKENLTKIDIPLLLAYAGREELVDNQAIIRASHLIAKNFLLELPTSKHEIMMETDDIRDQFLQKTLEFFNQ